MLVMSEVRSFSVSRWNRDLITLFDKVNAPFTSKIMWAVELYMGKDDKLPPFFGDIGNWVDYIGVLKGKDLKKFNSRLKQIEKIMGDVK